MKPPPYVAIVLPPFVRLEWLDGYTRKKLASHGVNIERDDAGYEAARFLDTAGDLPSNADFVETFRRLNEAGFAFGEDFKQGWSPADIMRELQNRNCITAPFTAVAWRGPKDWFTTVYENPQKTP